MAKSRKRRPDRMIGQTLNETYLLERRIGFGGMGRVYAGQHLRLSRPVAVKVLLSKYSANPDAVERFRHEARAASALGHPNIVEVFDFNKSESQHWYIVMELLEGEDLRALLKREKKLEPPACLPILRQTCDALDLAHSKGLVHRDLKPSNIFLRHLPGRREVKILDFGVAKVLGSEMGLTMDGAMLGTPHYMAPEQAAGESGLSPRVDVYAIGTVLFEMLCGRRPFEGDSPLSVLHLRATRDAPTPSSVVTSLPRSIDEVLGRALARNASERFESITELVLAFERALTEAGLPLAFEELRLPDDVATDEVCNRECVEAETVIGSDSGDAISVSDHSAVTSSASQSYVTGPPTSTSTSVVRLQSSDELRVATIVVVNATPADDSDGDPDVILELTESILEQISPEITRHGGSIEQSLGDSLIAVFGVPRAMGDEALRASRAALSVRDLGRRHAAKGVEVRVGIHTGRILKRASRSGVTGDVVKVATRLADECPAGEVLIGHETYLHIRGRFDVSFREQIRVRGVRKPLRTYRVTDERDHGVAFGPHGGQRGAGLAGRDPELAFLQALFRRATRENQAQAVLILGGAGTGKTRLAEELLAKLEERSERHSYFPARASELAAPSPYGLLAEVIRVKTESSRALTPAEAGQKLLDLVSWPFESGTMTGTMTSTLHGKQGIAPLEIANALGAAIGVPVRSVGSATTPPKPRADKLDEALASYLAALAERQPVLLVLDDLHRSDEESLDLLESTMRRLEDAPVMLVAMARPDLFENRPEFLTGFEHLTKIQLRSLSVVAVNGQITTLLGQTPPPGLAAAIHKRSGGNPHLVEEMIHTLREAGGLRRDKKHGVWLLRGDLDDLDVPSRAEALLQARLDQLPPTEREVLRCAAVIGAVFWEDALRHFGLESIASHLEALARADLVHARPTSRFPGTRQWAFKSELMCEVAGGNVPARDRRRIHLAMAEWLERLAKRDPETLSIRAHHLARGGQQSAALDLLAEAAEQAAHQQRWALALACYQRAHDLARTEGDQASQLFFAAFVGRLAVRAHVPSKGTAVLEEAATLAEESGDEATQANLLQLLGRNLAIQGEAARAREVTEQAREVAERLGDLRLRFEAAKALGFVLYYTDEFQGSADVFEQCMEMARELGDVEEVVINLYNVADSALAAGDRSRALEFAEKADKAGGDQEGLLFIQQKARGISAYLRALETKDPASVKALELWIGYADEQGYVDQQVEARFFLAEVLELMGQRAAARAIARFGLEIARKTDDNQSERRMLEQVEKLEAEGKERESSPSP